MERTIQLILETSLFMFGAILVLLLFSKLFAGKTRPALRHLCWLIVALGLLIPFRPAFLTFTLPQAEVFRQAETVPHFDRAFDFECVHNRYIIQNDAPSIVMPPVAGFSVGSDNTFYYTSMPSVADFSVGPDYAVYTSILPLMEVIRMVEALSVETAESIPIVSYPEPEAEAAGYAVYSTILTVIHENIWQLLFAVWATGALGFTLFCAIHHLYFIRRIKRDSHEITSGPLPDPLYNIFIRMRCCVGIRRKVRLMANENITVPMMYGYFRPVIILPAYLLNEDPIQQRLIILHEMLHIKRGDILTRLLYFTAVAVHWFNPLVHLMNRVALDELEKACDDAVLHHSDTKARAQYSKTLMHAAWQDTRARSALAHALTGGGKSMKNRLKNIITKTTPKRWVLVICTVLMVAGVIAFSLVNFTGRDDYEPEDAARDSYEEGGIHRLGGLEPGGVLRVLMREGSPIVHAYAVADALRESYGVEIEVSRYFIEELDHYRELIPSLLAAGMGPDIFVADFPLYRHIESGFLMDINELIPDRSLFNENALAGYEVDGRLYALPMSFSFNTVGINAALPPEFLARFAALETVSLSQMIQFYADLIDAHPEFVGFYFTNLLFYLTELNIELSHGLGFGDPAVTLDDAIAPLLYGIREHVHQNNRYPGYDTGDSSVEAMKALQENAIFHIPRFAGTVTDAFFPFEEPFFIHYIPMTDERGALINNTPTIPGFSVAVSTDADPTLAWAFIEGMLSETGTSASGGTNGSMHIMRAYAHDYFVNGMNFGLTLRTTRPITTSEAEAVSAAAERVLAYAERPSVHTATRRSHVLPPAVTNATLARFFDGGISAETALRDMENDISYWRGLARDIVPYVPEPPPAEILDVRSLTVHGSNEHTAMFQQAAAAMNASWQARGIPYAFELVMNDWRSDEWEGNAARNVRLQTELMAGQGPDIFVYSVWGNLNMRAMARNGLLADIYTLIDGCTLTSRGDFFENVLQAMEFDGGLYMLPMSFRFYQVGINAYRLPLHYIDAHAARETITPRELLETYLRVLDNPDFAHMNTGFTVLGDGISFLSAILPAFIDFDARSANFTDPRFIEQLELMRRVHPIPFFSPGTTVTNIGSPDFFANYLSDYVFEMSNFRMMAANPFFTRTVNHFVEYRPLADDAGRLMLSLNERDTWATLAIPAGGQPELAWEFIVYLMREYPRAEGRAMRAPPPFSSLAYWANQSINTPILRENADMPRRMFDAVTNPEGAGRSASWYFTGEREDYIDAAMARLAELNEMPIVLSDPMIPYEIFTGPEAVNFVNFTLGAITAEAYAQMIQNAVSLWLIE